MYSAIIIDEADYWVVQNVLNFIGKGKISGFCEVNENMRTHLFTGTANDWLKGLCRVHKKACLDDFYASYPTKMFISHGQAFNYNIAWHTCANFELQVNQFVEIARSKMNEQPLIIFVEGSTKLLETKLKLVSLEMGIDFKYLESYDEAMEIRREKQDDVRGVYLCHSDFQRGFDMKMAVDAYVMIFATEKGYKMSEIEQMIGRGSRAFGMASGAYFTYKFGETDKDITAELKFEDERMADSYLTVGIIYRLYPHMNPGSQALVRSVFNQGLLQMSQVKFRLA